MPKTESPTTQEIIKRGQRIKLPILAPLFTAILVLLGTFTFAIYRLQQQQIENEVLARLDNTRRTFNQLLTADSQLLRAISEITTNDPNIQNAWLTQDRQTLLSYSSPTFEKLKKDYSVTHLYFIDANNTCFLRVHNPGRFGDRIDRFTLLSSAKTHKPSWGIELGPYGTFTLRFVQPWFMNNTFCGFVEIGEEIEHITPQLKEFLDVDLAVLINKSLLTRKDWEEGQKMMGHTGQWDELSDSVIAYSTISSIPPKLLKFASMAHTDHKNRVFSSTLDGSTYRGGFVQLLNASGREVGDILIIKNVSKELTSMHKLLAIITTLSFLITALLVSFFYTHIARIEKHIIETHASLATEIEKRKEVESELRRHQDNLEHIVTKRTAELEETNKHIHNEITERKKIEIALRLSEERFKQVSECAGEWIWEVDAEGLYTYSSPVSEKLLGYKPEEIVANKHFYDFSAPDMKEMLKKAAFAFFQRKENFTGFINPVVNKNGETIILETTGAPVLDDKGNICGYRGADRNITERVNAQQRQNQLLEQLEETNKRLKEENAQRTRAEKSLEKLNTDLEVTVSKLIRSNRQLHEFAHLASHDLKTPLRGIGTLAQWLATDYYDKFDSDGRKQINMLIKRVELTDKIINAIFEYSTIVRNKRNENPINLNKMVKGVIAQIQPSQNFKIIVNNNLPTILSEENHIHKVFFNLVDNAVRFMDKSEGRIEINCEDEVNFWKFSVSDNGPGIEPQHHERIFQLFQTLGDSDQTKSTGAGLTIVRKIVELYDGRIWLISKPGEGTTFFFTWPKTLANVPRKTLQPATT